MTDTGSPLASEARRHFSERFGRPPTRIAQAPGRINLIGDHTDYAGGFVLPCAIDRRAVVAAAPAVPGRRGEMAASCLHSTARPGEVTVSLTEVAQPTGTWADRLLGVVVAARRDGLPTIELDLLLHSDVPIGAGLSSSAAIEVAFSTLLDDVHGRTSDPILTARRCQSAEHEFAGVPCGIMDPLVSAGARQGCAMLIDCRSTRFDQVTIPAALSILVVETVTRRDLAEGAYAERRQSVLDAATRIGVRALRDLLDGPDGAADRTPPDLAGASEALRAISTLPEPLRRRARHVHSENQRVLAAADALRRGDLDRFGHLLFESHASLRDDFEVSTPELDRVVGIAAALTSHGALGARLTGAGFGGAAIVACRRDRAAELAGRIAFELRAAGADPAVREAVPSEGASTVSGGEPGR